MNNDPALLRRRLRGGPTAEKETSQKIIMSFISIGYVALLVVSALDHRFGWSSPPAFLTIAADLLILLGLYIVFLVYRENSFSSATIEVAADQRVISTGPYAVVRHPMYAGRLSLSSGHAAGAGLLVGAAGRGGPRALFRVAAV